MVDRLPQSACLHQSDKYVPRERILGHLIAEPTALDLTRHSGYEFFRQIRSHGEVAESSRRLISRAVPIHECAGMKPDAVLYAYVNSAPALHADRDLIKRAPAYRAL